MMKQKDEISLIWETSQRSKNELFNALLRGYNQVSQSEEKSSEFKENEELTLDLNAIKQKNPK